MQLITKFTSDKAEFKAAGKVEGTIRLKEGNALGLLKAQYLDRWKGSGGNYTLEFNDPDGVLARIARAYLTMLSKYGKVSVLELTTPETYRERLSFWPADVWPERLRHVSEKADVFDYVGHLRGRKASTLSVIPSSSDMTDVVRRLREQAPAGVMVVPYGPSAYADLREATGSARVDLICIAHARDLDADMLRLFGGVCAMRDSGDGVYYSDEDVMHIGELVRDNLRSESFFHNPDIWVHLPSLFDAEFERAKLANVSALSSHLGLLADMAVHVPHLLGETMVIDPDAAISLLESHRGRCDSGD
jgi:hypothetical protein